MSRTDICAIYLLLIFSLPFLMTSASRTEERSRFDREIILSRLEKALTQRGYFTPLDAGLRNIRFFCVCGPYRTCEPESRKYSEKLGYQLPDYNFKKGISELRQKLLLFLDGEIVDIVIPYGPFYIAVEHESFCDANLEKRIPRSKEERDAD